MRRFSWDLGARHRAVRWGILPIHLAFHSRRAFFLLARPRHFPRIRLRRLRGCQLISLNVWLAPTGWLRLPCQSIRGLFSFNKTLVVLPFMRPGIQLASAGGRFARFGCSRACCFPFTIRFRRSQPPRSQALLVSERGYLRRSSGQVMRQPKQSDCLSPQSFPLIRPCLICRTVWNFRVW